MPTELFVGAMPGFIVPVRGQKMTMLKDGVRVSSSPKILDGGS